MSWRAGCTDRRVPAGFQRSRSAGLPGHNLFTYHKDPDGNVIELFTQIDRIADESKGYWEPRPWHETFPMYPKTWEIDALTANLWGPFDPSLLAR